MWKKVWMFLWNNRWSCSHGTDHNNQHTVEQSGISIDLVIYICIYLCIYSFILGYGLGRKVQMVCHLIVWLQFSATRWRQRKEKPLLPGYGEQPGTIKGGRGEEGRKERAEWRNKGKGKNRRNKGIRNKKGMNFRSTWVKQTSSSHSLTRLCRRWRHFLSDEDEELYDVCVCAVYFNDVC